MASGADWDEAGGGGGEGEGEGDGVGVHAGARTARSKKAGRRIASTAYPKAAQGSRVDPCAMTKLRVILALAALVAAASSCAAPLQNGGVEVRPGVAERLDAMCRFANGNAGAVCAPPADE